MESNELQCALAFKQISKTANSPIPLKKAVNLVAASTARALRVNGCVVMTLNPGREYLDILGSYGLSDMYLRKGVINPHKSYPEIHEGKVVTSLDFTSDKRTQYPAQAVEENILSMMGAPVFQKDEVVGQIRVYSKQKRHFKPIEKDFLTSVANILSLLIEKYELNSHLNTQHETNIMQQKKLTSFSSLPLAPLRSIAFSHPSEEEFSHLLDFYQVEWLYEPRSFPLSWEDNRITEMFTPDFYLPELNLYIELTTTRQNLMTEKNRKLRRLKELHPDINIRLLNKNDYLNLFAKYDLMPLGQNKMEGIVQLKLSKTVIQRKVKALARQISSDYQGKDLIIVGVLKGVICFMSDLMKQISIPLMIDFMAISNPESAKESLARVTKDLDLNIENKHVLMVEDIVDTGMTLHYLLNYLAAKKPASLKVCTLLDKRVRRLINLQLDYVGFEVGDEFVVGYGLDVGGKYRNLDFIGKL